MGGVIIKRYGVGFCLWCNCKFEKKTKVQKYCTKSCSGNVGRKNLPPTKRKYKTDEESAMEHKKRKKEWYIRNKAILIKKSADYYKNNPKRKEGIQLYRLYGTTKVTLQQKKSVLK